MLAAYFDLRPDLVRYFSARMRSAPAAEDLVQDLYIRIAALDPDQSPDDPSALLFRIANNLMLDRLRSERRLKARSEAWAMTEGGAAVGDRVSDQPSPEAAACGRQDLKRMLEAVSRLPARTRQAFELHKLRGLTQHQTAQAMHVSAGTVEKQVSAALRQLGSVLGRTAS